MSYELSEKQIQETIKSFNESFKKWSVFRYVFKVVIMKDELHKIKDDYVTIGFNHVMGKKWFSDLTGDTYYDHESLGMTRGKGVALGETRYILNQINEIVEKMEISIHVPKPDITQSLLRTIRSNKNIDLVILVHPSLITSIMDDDNFKIINRVGILGYFLDVPVIWSPEVQKESVYVLNRNVGLINVKQDSSLEILDLDVSEYGQILKDIDTLTMEELPSMVRVIAKETIKFTLRSDQPLIMRKIKCSDLDNMIKTIN